MASMPQVRGTVLRGILKDAKETLASGVPVLMSYLREEDR